MSCTCMFACIQIVTAAPDHSSGLGPSPKIPQAERRLRSSHDHIRDEGVGEGQGSALFSQSGLFFSQVGALDVRMSRVSVQKNPRRGLSPSGDLRLSSSLASSLRGLPESITSVPTAEALHSAASQHTRVAAISEPECTLSTGGLPDEETDAGITSQQDDQQGGGASDYRRRWNRANACASERPAARCPAQPTRCPALNPLALRLWLQLWRLRRLQLRLPYRGAPYRSACNCG